MSVWDEPPAGMSEEGLLRWAERRAELEAELETAASAAEQARIDADALAALEAEAVRRRTLPPVDDVSEPEPGNRVRDLTLAQVASCGWGGTKRGVTFAGAAVLWLLAHLLTGRVGSTLILAAAFLGFVAMIVGSTEETGRALGVGLGTVAALPFLPFKPH